LKKDGLQALFEFTLGFDKVHFDMAERLQVIAFPWGGNGV
jgi:hypothetical protein